MNIQNFLLLLLILLSFLAIVILPSSLNICLPSGCSFNNIDVVCGNNACAGETIISHLSERAQLFSATVKFQPHILFVIFVIVLFVVKKYLESRKLITAKSYFKQKLLNSSALKLFDYLIEVFSRGILHSKIY